MQGEASPLSAGPRLCRKTFTPTNSYKPLPTFTAPFRDFVASKFDAKLHAPKRRQQIRKRLTHGPQKATKIVSKSEFIVQAGMHNLAAIYNTLTTFVPPGTDQNIAQNA